MKLRNLARVLTFVCLVPLAAAFAQGPGIVEIGIVPSLLADMSKGQQKFISEEFPLLVKEFTGLPGQLDKVGSAKELADKLNSGTVKFGVFQGVEFAETQAKNPDLQPLLLSVYRTPQIKALMVTKKDATYKSFADLRGKDVAILKEGKEHIRRYAHKEAGGDPAKFFSKVITPANSEAALDSVLKEMAEAVIVDTASLDIYRSVNPGRFNRLKVIGESATFPPAVIAYVPKKADASLVKRFKTGMQMANATAKGRDVMSTFKITEFAAVPTGFEKTLEDIRKAYPE
jgi:ABC-type phosphate/phosphonate transport system substrate-binding protein